MDTDHDATHDTTPPSDGSSDITMAESPNIAVMEFSPSPASTIAPPNSSSPKHQTTTSDAKYTAHVIEEQPGTTEEPSMDDDDAASSANAGTAPSVPRLEDDDYAEEILTYMRKLEVECLPDPEYIRRHPELTWAARRRIIDHIINLHSYYDLSPPSLWLTINLFDRYLSLERVDYDKRWLVEWAAFFIAWKFEEVVPPTKSRVVGPSSSAGNYGDGTPSVSYYDVVKAEKYMLRVLEYNVSKYCSPLQWIKEVDPEQKPLVEFLVELAMLDHRFLGVKSSSIAAAAIYTANRILIRSSSDIADSMAVDSASNQDLESHFDLLVQNMSDPDLEGLNVFRKHNTDCVVSARKWAIGFMEAEELVAYSQRFKEQPDPLSDEFPELPPHEDVPEAPSPLPETIPIRPLIQSTPKPKKKRALSRSTPSPVRGGTVKKRRRLDDGVDAGARCLSVASSTETLQVLDDDGDISMGMEGLEVTSSAKSTSPTPEITVTVPPEEEDSEHIKKKKTAVRTTVNLLSASEMDSSEYAEDILTHLKTLEVQCIPDPEYLSRQKDLTWNMRRTAIDDLIKLHSHHELAPDTLWIACNIVDRFLSLRAVSANKLNLVVHTALFIAWKYEEVVTPTRKIIESNFGDNDFTFKEILVAEKYILKMLDFHVSGHCSPHPWLRSIPHPQRELCDFLVELALLDHRFLSVTPRELADVAMYMANKITGHVSMDCDSDENLQRRFEWLVHTLSSSDVGLSVYKKHDSNDRLHSSSVATTWAMGYCSMLST